MSSGSRRAIAPPVPDLAHVARAVTIPVLSQHVDAGEAGARTGYVPVEAVAAAGSEGSLVNHSEHPMPIPDIEDAVRRLSDRGLVVVVCAADVPKARRLAETHAPYLAVEPPELIGGDRAVSTARPEVVSGTVIAVHSVAPGTRVLCGAGVHDRLRCSPRPRARRRRSPRRERGDPSPRRRAGHPRAARGLLNPHSPRPAEPIEAGEFICPLRLAGKRRWATPGNTSMTATKTSGKTCRRGRPKATARGTSRRGRGRPHTRREHRGHAETPGVDDSTDSALSRRTMATASRTRTSHLPFGGRPAASYPHGRLGVPPEPHRVVSGCTASSSVRSLPISVIG